MVLENLFLLKVSSFSSLDEFVSEVFVPHLQVVKSVAQSSDFLLALADFSVELVALPLQLFFFLRGLDDIVGLGVLAYSLDFA